MSNQPPLNELIALTAALRAGAPDRFERATACGLVEVAMRATRAAAKELARFNRYRDIRSHRPDTESFYGDLLSGALLRLFSGDEPQIIRLIEKHIAQVEAGAPSDLTALVWTTVKLDCRRPARGRRDDPLDDATKTPEPRDAPDTSPREAIEAALGNAELETWAHILRRDPALRSKFEVWKRAKLAIRCDLFPVAEAITEPGMSEAAFEKAFWRTEKMLYREMAALVGASTGPRTGEDLALANLPRPARLAVRGLSRLGDGGRARTSDAVVLLFWTKIVEETDGRLVSWLSGDARWRDQPAVAFAEVQEALGLGSGRTIGVRATAASARLADLYTLVSI